MLIKKYTIIDTHCDTILKIDEMKLGLASEGFDFNLNDALSYGGYAQFFATWVDMKKYGKVPFECANKLIGRLKTEFEANKKEVLPAFCADDLNKAFSQNKLAAVLSLEGAEALEGKIENLQHFYNLGIRCMSLTWNYKNKFAYGAMSPLGGGLTIEGRELVREMNRLGIIIDVSHLSEQSFWDVLDLSTAPVIASHSCSMSVCRHRRNLTDEQFKALIQKGGVVGLNFYTKFLTKRKKATIDDIIAHFEHFLSLGGEDAIGIGTDFDGASAYPIGLSSTAEIASLLEALEQRGYSQSVINKFSSCNMITLINKVMV